MAGRAALRCTCTATPSMAAVSAVQAHTVCVVSGSCDWPARARATVGLPNVLLLRSISPSPRNSRFSRKRGVFVDRPAGVHIKYAAFFLTTSTHSNSFAILPYSSRTLQTVYVQRSLLFPLHCAFSFLWPTAHVAEENHHFSQRLSPFPPLPLPLPACAVFAATYPHRLHSTTELL